MRLELLLIFGILFFCCWCAFIVARMNWSVAVPAPPPSQQPPLISSASGQHANLKTGRELWLASAAVQQPQIDLVRANHHLAEQANRSLWRPTDAEQRLSFARLVEASQPVARFQEPQATQQASIGYLSGQGHQAAWPPQQPINLPAPPPGQLIEADEGGGGGGGANEEDDNSPEQDNNNNVNNEPEEQPATEANQDEESQRQQQQQQQDDNPEGQSDEENDEPQQAPSREHLEQASERRSFSEDLSDSNERDRDGKLVVTKRSHIVNGKPMKRGSRTRGSGRSTGKGSGGVTNLSEEKFDEPDREEEEDEEEQDNGQVNSKDNRKRELDREFAKVVSEIDSERDRRSKKRTGNRRPGKGEVAAAATTTTSSATMTGSASKSRRDPAASTKAISKRMMAIDAEADATAATSATSDDKSGAKVKAETKPSRWAPKLRPGKHSAVIRPPALHEHRVQETLSAQQWDDNSPSPGEEHQETPDGDHLSDEGDIVDEDAEAQKLEELSRELLASPPPETTTTAGLDRRRRQVTSGPEMESNFTRAQAVNVAGGVALLDLPAATLNPLMNSSETNQTAAIVSLNELAIKKDNITDQWTNLTWGANLADERRDILAGQDDISIEVLADPPPPLMGANSSSFYTGPYLASSPVAQPTLGPPAPPAVFGYQGPQMVGSFPQIGSPLASGSYKKKAVSVKKKKKVAKKKKKKGNMEKYKSAKAHKKKMKSKRKKGES